MQREWNVLIYKVMGGCFVFVGTAALGIYFAGQYIERLKNLIELKKAMMQMQGELRYLHSTMPDLFETVGRRTNGTIGEFFLALSKEMEQKTHGDFSNIWTRQVMKKITPSVLEPEAKTILLETGKQLADTDRRTKEEGLTFALKQMEDLIQKRKEEKQNRLKLYYVCGIMVGLMLTILLV